MYHDETATSEDESFGPGTDLVISLFAILLILVAFWWYYDRIAAAALGSSPKDRKKQLYEFREGAQKSPSFGKDNALLTVSAISELDTEVSNFWQALQSGSYNQLQIIGHASADTVRGDKRERERQNLALSLARAAAVADHLYLRGIPYECMSISGFGRSQSKVLKRWLEAHPGTGIRDWDAQGQYSREVNSEQLAGERRVEIWGIWHPNSQCELARLDGDSLES